MKVLYNPHMKPCVISNDVLLILGTVSYQPISPSAWWWLIGVGIFHGREGTSDWWAFAPEMVITTPLGRTLPTGIRTIHLWESGVHRHDATYAYLDLTKLRITNQLVRQLGFASRARKNNRMVVRSD